MVGSRNLIKNLIEIGSISGKNILSECEIGCMMIREDYCLAGIGKTAQIVSLTGSKGWGGTVRAEGKVYAKGTNLGNGFPPGSSQRRPASLRICSRRVGYTKEDSICTRFLLGKLDSQCLNLFGLL